LTGCLNKSLSFVDMMIHNIDALHAQASLRHVNGHMLDFATSIQDFDTLRKI
jgi:hypothetical protein